MTLSVKTVASLEKTLMKINKIALMEVREAKSAEHASSIFKKTAVNTDPLAMDAKATLAKLGVTTNSESTGITKFDDAIKNCFSKFKISGYDIFESTVLKEVHSAIKPLEEKVFCKINPINVNNLDFIKTELLPLIENSELKQKILECTNSDELFIFIKANMEKIQYVDYKPLSFKVLDSGITPELEKEYSILGSHEVKKRKKIFDILTPKSKNPEVLKIEEEIRQLGVKDVNFSDDLEQAKLIKEAIEDIVAKKVTIKAPLPKSIVITPALPKSANGGLGAHSQEGGYMWLPTSAENELIKETDLLSESLIKNSVEFQKAPVEYQERFLIDIENRKKYLSSTKNPKHYSYHEYAHTFQPNSLESELQKLSSNEMETAREISIYANSLRNGKEAMPEMFAKLMDGQQLTEKQMELYLKLGGIIPQF